MPYSNDGEIFRREIMELRAENQKLKLHYMLCHQEYYVLVGNPTF